ncbi:hypothetical protein C0991_009110 [Blastosporella zonata]|nr:hypothetical protein C0991_009110 [Blastosporella zonata]
MLDNTKLTVVGITVALLALGHHYVRRSLADRKLPPGPSGIPFLGNVMQVPGTHLATYFRRLLEEYGGLVSLNFAGTPVILVGDIKVAKELLERHSAKNSSRPNFHYFRHYIDPTNSNWVLREDNKSHAIARKLTTGIMSDVRVGKTEPLHEFEAMLNIVNLLEDGGKDWFHHMKRYAWFAVPIWTVAERDALNDRVSASTVLAASFGMHCPTGHEQDLNTIIDALAEAVLLSTPTATIVNFLPFLDWIPGPMPWRIRAQLFCEREDMIYNKVINHAVTGEAWAAAFAREDKPEGDQRHLIRVFTGAAIETTTISLHTFVLACIRYPEWIDTAQRELDNVVGSDRFPSFKDRPFLPYIEAIVRETLRWRPAARFGIPHQSTASHTIEYQGREYFIPKGSTIFAVTWAMEHDQAKFEDHDRFMPERFLDGDGKLKPDYETSAFGFGRRVCPGVPFAERSLWIDIATLLWTFNIRKSDVLDPKTNLRFNYDDSDAAFGGDITNTPFWFPAAFEPRSPQRAEVARREWAECEKDLNTLLPAPKDK